MVKVHILEGSNNIERLQEAEPVPAGVGVPQGVVLAVAVAVVVLGVDGSMASFGKTGNIGLISIRRICFS